MDLTNASGPAFRSRSDTQRASVGLVSRGDPSRNQPIVARRPSSRPVVAHHPSARPAFSTSTSTSCSKGRTGSASKTGRPGVGPSNSTIRFTIERTELGRPAADIDRAALDFGRRGRVDVCLRHIIGIDAVESALARAQPGASTLEKSLDHVGDQLGRLLAGARRRRRVAGSPPARRTGRGTCVRTRSRPSGRRRRAMAEPAFGPPAAGSSSREPLEDDPPAAHPASPPRAAPHWPRRLVTASVSRRRGIGRRGRCQRDG